MKTALLSTLLLFASSPAMAAAFALTAQSTEALGAATAGAQAAEATPGNIYFNPSSIVGVKDVEASLSVVFALNNSNYANADGVLLGTVPVAGQTQGEAPLNDGIFPAGAIAKRYSDRIYLGLAFYAPYGFGSSYADDSVVRYHGTESKLFSLSLTPVVGFALNDKWSFAAGPRFQYADVTLGGAVDAAGAAAAAFLPGFIPGTEDAFYEIEANSFDVGFTVGLQGKLTEALRIGASFNSKIDHSLSGDAVFDVSNSLAAQTLQTVGLFQDSGVRADFATPAVAQFGAQLDVAQNVTLMASVTFTRWSNFENLTALFDSPVQPPEVITQNWNDAWAGSLGAEIALSPASQMRFGVMYEDAPVDEAFMSPRIPDGDRIWGAVGFTQRLSGKAKLNIAASYLVAGDMTIRQPATLPENLLRGGLNTDIENDAFVFSLGMDVTF